MSDWTPVRTAFAGARWQLPAAVALICGAAAVAVAAIPRPLAAAPAAPHVATLGEADSVRALLMRSGVHFQDSVRAGILIDGASPLPPGSRFVIDLGERSGPTRAVKRIAVEAADGTRLLVFRDRTGTLRLRSPVRPAGVAAAARPARRIRGRVGDGLYWSLRAAGATPQVAAVYLQALSTEIDVGGDILPDDRFDLVLARPDPARGDDRPALLYAGVERVIEDDVQLVRWDGGGGARWINAATVDRPVTTSTGLAMPVSARITSGFGTRVHPILRFARQHNGIDFGAGWGTPIQAAADGVISKAGWAGGYGRQVRIAHPGGLSTSYSHMSTIAAAAGSFVRRGEVIGYVGSSGLSTGPHLHYEVHRDGRAINPLGLRFTTTQMVDTRTVNAVRARLKALLAQSG